MHIVFTIANNSSVPYFNWFAEFAAKQNKHQFSFIAFCKDKPKMIDDVAAFGWKCYWVKFDHEQRKKSMISSFFAVFKLLKKINPDVVHSHLFDDAVPSLLASKLLNIKVRAIVKADTGFHFKYAPQWIKIDKLNNVLATDIVTPSNESMKFVLDVEKADPNKISMIHHGIPSKIFTKQSESYQRDLIKKYQLDGRIVIGTVSRLIDWKGYKNIIEAAEQVVKKHPEALFLFVGEGEQRQELETMIKEKNLQNNIVLTGWIQRDYIPSLYGILDVYVHAASFEPFGFVIPEAMMNGAPVVSTPTGSALDAISHKENGYLTTYQDSNSITEGILYAIKHGKDFSEKGRETALKMYEFETMFNNYINLYEKSI